MKDAMGLRVPNERKPRRRAKPGAKGKKQFPKFEQEVAERTEKSCDQSAIFKYFSPFAQFPPVQN